MNILILDNYDSFTYNLVQYVRELTPHTVHVFRNDALTDPDPARWDAVIFSPGPGIPAEAGQMPALIKKWAGRIPLLGVCLGHQAIAEAFGAELLNLEKVYHGIATDVHITDPQDPLFNDLPASFTVGRYHSWVVQNDHFPDDLVITARDPNGQIMALRHRKWPIWGVQFHPESILTPDGKTLLSNFLTQCESIKTHTHETSTHESV